MILAAVNNTNDRLDAAKAFAARGWAIFPCHSIEDGRCTCGDQDCGHAAKHPRTANGLHDATTDASRVAKWWKRWPEANVAIATGDTSKLLVIDIDPANGGDESFEQIQKELGLLPATVTVETGGGGRHLYFRYPAGRKIASRSGWRPGIDIKSDRGYVIAPPSNHASGGSYRFAERCAPEQIELAEVPDSWLEQLPQERNDDPTTRPPRDRIGVDDGPLWRRARSYVQKADPAMQGSRNDNAFRLAGNVGAFRDEHENGLDEDAIFALLRDEWNPRCNPPLDEHELQQCVTSALKNGTPREPKAPPTGLELFGDSPFDEDKPADRIAKLPRPIEKFSLAGLCDKYPHLNPTVIDGLLREGETCNVISYSKIGKSWLGYSMLLSVVHGKKWLNRFEAEAGKVLLVDNELHRSTIASRIPIVAQNLFPFDDEIYRRQIDVWPLRGQLRSLAELEAEFQQIEPKTYKLIVFDAMYRFAIDGVSENDNAAMAAFYNRLDRIAERTKAAVVLIHHTTKGNQSEKRVTDVGAGAGAQSRAADCHLILREHEEDGVVVLAAAVRSFKSPEPLALRWNYPIWTPAEGVDPKRLKTGWTQRRKQDDVEAISKITAALRDGPATKTKLAEKARMGHQRVKRILTEMEGAGLVRSRPATVSGNPTVEFELVPVHDEAVP